MGGNGSDHRLIANLTLGVLCCSRRPDPPHRCRLVPAPSLKGCPHRARAYARAADRQAILARNLFSVSVLSQPPPRLRPGRRLGQRSCHQAPRHGGGRRPASWRRWEPRTRKHSVVRPQDQLRGQATVLRRAAADRHKTAAAMKSSLSIRRRSTEAEASGTCRCRGAAGPCQAGADGDQVRQLAENRFQVARSDVGSAARNPAALFPRRESCRATNGPGDRVSSTSSSQEPVRADQDQATPSSSSMASRSTAPRRARS
jgi:hypothetical protein